MPINYFETSFEARARRAQTENLYHGETFDLVATVATDGVPQILNGYAISAIYQPTSMHGSDDFYALDAEIVNNRIVIHWSEGKDFGADSYMVWGLLSKEGEASFPVSWKLNFAYSPNYPLSDVAPIPKSIDFSKYELLNAPWALLSDFQDFQEEVGETYATKEEAAEISNALSGYLPLSGGDVTQTFQLKSFGRNVLSGLNGALAIGIDSAARSFGVAIGYKAKSEADLFAGVAVGEEAKANGKYSVAVGTYAHAKDDNSTALGSNSAATGAKTVAVGFGAKTSNEEAIAIGHGSNANAQRAIQIGYGTNATAKSLKVFDKMVLSGDNLTLDPERVPYLSGYAKKEDIPEVPTDLSAFTNSPGYLTAHQSLSDYYTKEEADGKFLTAHQDLTDYATKEFVQSEISDFITEDALTGLATKEEVQAVDDKLSDYAEKEELTAYAQLSDIPELPEDVVRKDDLSVYAQLSDLENIDVDGMSACLSSDEFQNESYLSANAFGELDANAISLEDLGNKINKILQLLKRDSNGPRGGDPTKTYVKYLDGTISELNIVGQLGENSVPNKENARNVQIGNTVTSIGSKAFFQCTNLETIDIPTTVTSFGGGAWYSSPFYGCSKLKTFSIPNGVTAITNYMLGGCSNLMIDLTIPSSVTYIGTGAFSGCPATFVFDGKTMAEVQAMERYSWDIPTGQGRIVCTDGTL